jgi:hypothetical protein
MSYDSSEHISVLEVINTIPGSIMAKRQLLSRTAEKTLPKLQGMFATSQLHRDNAATL